MNRNLYRLIFNPTLGMLVPQAETARSRSKRSGGAALSGVVLASVALSAPAFAALPVAANGVGMPNFVTYGQASYQAEGKQALINQVGNKSILNWRSFNVSAGNSVQFRQVDANGNLVNGASFTSLNRIWDTNPSVIAGALTQGAGQKGNVILVNNNGVAFMGGAQVNLNSFTATSLNIADTFVTNGLLGDNLTPQFSGTGGFVKVFEGAKITAGSEGRVMLLAPTVVNKGTVEAPGGQIILAAGTKVYLRSADDGNLNVRGLLVEVDSPTGLNAFDTPNAGVTNGTLDGATVALTDVADDKLGHATNTGTLSTPRGNVTMVGYAVNQSGIARATTSVVANGSVYLMAKDTSVASGSSRASSRGGQVTLGAGSLTEVLPETNDATSTVDGNTGSGMAQASEVRVLGKKVTMAQGAAIVAPSGTVELLALDDFSGYSSKTTPLDIALTTPSNTARIHMESGSRIDVSGLNGVEVSAARNTIEVELRGDELKDSPINQQGPLRGQKAYIDAATAYADALAGKDTLIAKDSLLAYLGKVDRTVAERSTAGGTVSIRSEGETILEHGSTIDLSGGSLRYTPATVKTTLLSSKGKMVSLTNATADKRYDAIANRFVIDYDRWNRTETIELGQTFRYDPGYLEGKAAGKVSIIGMGATVMQADVQGRTLVGDKQRQSGAAPAGATLTIGTDTLGSDLLDYKLNQKVVIGRNLAGLRSSFGIGDALGADQLETLNLDADLLGEGKLARLNVFTNQAAEVRDALRTPQGGGITLVGNNVTIKAAIDSPSGTIALAARNNVFAELNDPLLQINDGVALTARGAWVNDRTGVPKGDGSLPQLDGGSIELDAGVTALSGQFLTRGTVRLGEGVALDASAGARIASNGKVNGGKGGSIAITGFAVEGLGDAASALALQNGGSLSVSANKVRIGGTATPEFGALALDQAFFTRGGFSSYSINGLSALNVADNANVQVRSTNLQLQDDALNTPTGGAIADITDTVILDSTQRRSASIKLASKLTGADSGALRIGTGAILSVDPQGTVALEARHTLDVQGKVLAPAGTISLLLDRSAGFTAFAPNENALWLGAGATLDASGLALTYLAPNGTAQGKVLAGGTVALNAKTGYVVGQTGSQIKVSGASPVGLDVANEAGGLGRMVGSDAGTVTVFAEEGILLDSRFAAAGGGTTNRGGTLNISLSKNARIDGQTGFDSVARRIAIANTVAPQTAGLNASSAIPLVGDARGRLAADRIEAGGFDVLSVSSRDAIVLENGLTLGAGGALPMREIKLDAARIETQGGNASITADTVRLGNFDTSNRLGGTNTASTTGTLTANARLLELAGDVRLRGMATADLTGSEQVRLAAITHLGLSNTGQSTGKYENNAQITAAGNLTLRGAVVAPSSFATINIAAPGKTVRIESNGQSPLQPQSALASVTVEAQDIHQAGVLWAPLGKIELAASGSVNLEPGSVTSVSASGALLPLGQVQNGKNWVVNVNPAELPAGQLAVGSMPEKAVRLSGTTVKLKTGSKVDLAGGGDLVGYEFTVGPGGSRDMLTDANTYAILPGYSSGFAPLDPQEKFDRRSGEAVYLSGVPGLANGTYTLLPAHYALLPGAYAVRLGNTTSLLPGKAYTRDDGLRVASGYVTDTRSGAPRDADWRGIQVLTREQVLARSELTSTPASSFFAGGNNLPADAGRLSVSTTGTGSNSLQLNANFSMAAATGGKGAMVDISAPNIAVVDASSTGVNTSATQVKVEALNALGARSILIGATRTTAADATTLSVGATAVTLANTSTALAAEEVMLAATQTLTLEAGSAVNAQGNAGDAGTITTAGMGAFARVASTTGRFSRTGSPGTTQGVLQGAGNLAAASSVTLDATQDNLFTGNVAFQKAGSTVAGNLAVGASRIHLGTAPVGNGVSYTQSALDALNSLESLTFSSYSTFNLVGGVSVGLNSAGSPSLQNLTLQGAGLAGVANAGQTAKVGARNLTLSNPAEVAFTAGSTLGSGNLQISADTLTLGAGTKAIQGYAQNGTAAPVTITSNEVVAQGSGSTTVAGNTVINASRISADAAADQTLSASGGALLLDSHTADRTLAGATALGGKWAFSGDSVTLNTAVVLPSGTVKMTAASGDVTLNAGAQIKVAGETQTFFDVARAPWAGTVELTSTAGNVTIASDAEVNVSAAAGGDAGTLAVRASAGAVSIAVGSVQGTNTTDSTGQTGDGARAQIDALTVNGGYSGLNQALNSGGFGGERSVRQRSGNLVVASSDTTLAKNISLAADAGTLTVDGTLNAAGTEAGRIELFSSGNLQLNGNLIATASGTGQRGGRVELGTKSGSLNLAAGTVQLAGGSGGNGGKLLLRTARTGISGSGSASGGTGVAVTAMDSTVTGASEIALEGVQTYTGKTTLTATGTTPTTALSLATVNTNNSNFAAQYNNVRSNLGFASGNRNFNTDLTMLAGVEVQSAADLALSNDWNLALPVSGSTSTNTLGSLTLRAAGNLAINANLSDGFSVTTPFASGTTPATVLGGNSWSYRLVAGADLDAANSMAVSGVRKNFSLSNDKLVRTGTGDIRVAASGNITLGNTGSVIYTAGKRDTAVLAAFKAPVITQRATFTKDGGDVNLVAQGDITGSVVNNPTSLKTTQLYTDWLFRQGRLNEDGSAYATTTGSTSSFTPAWWIRFDQFRQGIATLGGGNVNVTAGGNVVNVAASAANQGRLNSAVPDDNALVINGGGQVHVEAGGNLSAGQYYATQGEVVLKVGGTIGFTPSQVAASLGKSVGTVIALGDASARVQGRGEVNIQAILNPTMLPQSSGSGDTFNTGQSSAQVERRSVFSSYASSSQATLESLNGDVNLQNSRGQGEMADMKTIYTPLGTTLASSDYMTLLNYLPPILEATSYQSSVNLNTTTFDARYTVLPSANGQINLLAAKNVALNASLTVSDRDVALIASVARPTSLASNLAAPASNFLHAASPVHMGDAGVARIYARDGDVASISQSFGSGNTTTTLVVPKQVAVRAGNDVVNLNLQVQHSSSTDRSTVQAARDVVYASGTRRTESDGMKVAGPGQLEVTAGRNVNLGTSSGVVSVGNLDNANLAPGGAALLVNAGVGAAGVDYAGVVTRLIDKLAAGAVDDSILWQARWLTGNTALSQANALSAVRAVDRLGDATRRERVRDMLFTALRTAGRDSNDASSAFAGEFNRGYDALELAFPGIADKATNGSFANYGGEINLFASRIKTSQGGSIEFMNPGGKVVVGLANTPAALVNVGNNVLGMVVSADGDVKGFSRGDMLVNQSRILTLGGGDVMLWSSEGGIDAGKGKKTASSVPAPVIKIDSQGNVTQELQGAATGSGIGALSSAGVTAGDVDLIAPKGTIDAGDAGIRAGNLNVAALDFKGADNVSVQGTSTGTPVADTGAVTASASGATSGGDDVSKTAASLSQAASDAARTAQSLAGSFKPSIVRVDIIGFGE